MVEKQVLVDAYPINYEGLFSVQEMYEAIDKFVTENRFTKKEISNSEVIKKDGRFVNLHFEIWRELSDYAKTLLKIKMKFEDVKDVEIEKEGYKKSMNQGKVSFIVYAYLETDFEHKWENTPGFFFVRVLFDKYIFKPFTRNYKAMVMQDFTEFTNEITAVLNLNKY